MPADSPAQPQPRQIAVDREVQWLERRRELLLRSIAEMQHHQIHPHLDAELLPDVGEMLAWAKEELDRVDWALTELSDRGRLPSGALPDSDPASEA
jgi:hypothetical protein